MKLSAVLWKEEDQWVALCPELDVVSQGDNPEHALEMLKEAVEVYIEAAKDLGVWEEKREEKTEVLLTTLEV